MLVGGIFELIFRWLTICSFIASLRFLVLSADIGVRCAMKNSLFFFVYYSLLLFFFFCFLRGWGWINIPKVLSSLTGREKKKKHSQVFLLVDFLIFYVLI